MRVSASILIAILVAQIPCTFSSVAAQSAGLSAEEVRKIVQDEMQKREAALAEREQAVIKREQAVKAKEEKVKTTAAAPAETAPAAATAAVSPAPGAAPAGGKYVRSTGPLALQISGYGDIQADFYDRAESADQPEGSRGQSKTTFDTERFVLELEALHAPSGIEIESEIEFEHGGTGASQEIEFDEFGEFETEVEKGGEVLIEELYVRKVFDNGLSVKAGRFYIGVGSLSYNYLPTSYLAVRRPETEEVMLPGQWDEIGLSLEQPFEWGRLTVQVVNGLDSSGFGASNWVASGHQGSFESIRAEDLAGILRVDLDSIIPDFNLGAAVYAGNTTGNRPKDDLDVDGTVVIGAVDYRYWTNSFRFQGASYLGDLSDAEEISERNSRLSNTQGVDRTPVADGAFGTWAEVGYNIAPALNFGERHQLYPFFRYDYYDTYFDTRASLPDNGRFERAVYTGGLAYVYDTFLTLKVDGYRRDFGGDGIESQDALGLGIGFVY